MFSSCLRNGLLALLALSALSRLPADGFNNDGQTDILWRYYSTNGDNGV